MAVILDIFKCIFLNKNVQILINSPIDFKSALV